MELRQLQYFLMVAQEQSFAKAAKKTYVSQQALSKSVLSLEQELGVPLFERLPHGVELTEYGQTLLKKAYRITNSVNEAVSEIHNMKDNVGRTIQLAITTGVEDTFQVKDLLRFQDIYPQYRISTIASTDREIERMMLSEKIELGILGARGDSSKLDFTCLRESATLLAVHKDNPLSQRASVCLEDLKEECSISGAATTTPTTGCGLSAICWGFPRCPPSDRKYYIHRPAGGDNGQGIFLCPATSMESFDYPNIRLVPIRDDPKIFSVHLATRRIICSRLERPFSGISYSKSIPNNSVFKVRHAVWPHVVFFVNNGG